MAFPVEAASRFDSGWSDYAVGDDTDAVAALGLGDLPGDDGGVMRNS
ncbi:hypothetical protein [Novosphingobium cyanobacteriorum]|uniref:Uncharacterized protein n=1 Tax=Novosphingobium cyanobacteriorum TaxID=3024215 RepID=A0ABT6CP18_9SPHN|nr:hypothetical protein [Novosphingobium cyanobacteriorum]MDF8334983.1 hypothetical protein [Novosphingobium cyanobacteriorum]